MASVLLWISSFRILICSENPSIAHSIALLLRLCTRPLISVHKCAHVLITYKLSCFHPFNWIEALTSQLTSYLKCRPSLHLQFLRYNSDDVLKTPCQYKFIMSSVLATVHCWHKASSQCLKQSKVPILPSLCLTNNNYSVQVLSMSDELRRALYSSGASVDMEFSPPDLIGTSEIFTMEHRWVTTSWTRGYSTCESERALIRHSNHYWTQDNSIGKT